MIRILAIDDDAGRYDHLVRLLEGRAELVIACCPGCVARELPAADAVLLDYDLDSGEACAACGGRSEYAKGTAYAPAVAARQVPVIVTSASHPTNRRRLLADLHHAGLGRRLRTEISANETDPELRWLGWLWVVGVLDATR